MGTNGQQKVALSLVVDSGRRSVRGAERPEVLLERLRVEGFAGPVTAALREDLWGFGWVTLNGLVRTGKVHTVKIGHPHSNVTATDRRTLHESSEARTDLVLDTLGRAVPTFIGMLKKGWWKPDGGASLETYFIGACASAFWRSYDEWSAARQRQVLAIEASRLHFDEHAHTDDPSRTAEDRESLRLLLSDASAEERVICAGLLQDLTQAEIGAMLKLSPRAVEGRLRRMRGRAQHLVATGRIEPRRSRRTLEAAVLQPGHGAAS